MPFYFSTGTSSVERILRTAYGNISIGTTMTDSLSATDISNFIQDGERYILGIIEDTISSIPSPVPNSLSFSADYLGAYFVYSAIFAANKPDELSPVVLSWKEMAEKAIKSYKGGYTNDANIAAYASATKIFNTRGIKGIGDGVLKDSDDIKDHRIS